MKNLVVMFALLSAMLSCKGHEVAFEQKAYNFDNFKGTPLEGAALAARNDDGRKVRELLSTHKDIIDLKDPLFQQTLLALTIQNNKREAFNALLEAGASPNTMLSEPVDATPFIYGVKSVKDCDLYFVKQMLSHGADPNLEVKFPEGKPKLNKGYPLLIAISNRTSEGDECLDLVKLLVDQGADLNVCQMAPSGFCEGVVTLSLRYERMENLKYFVIEKKVNLPDVAYAPGGVNKATQRKYNLSEALQLPEFEYNDPEHERLRITKEEILSYLNSKK